MKWGRHLYLYQQQAAGAFGLCDNPFSCLLFVVSLLSSTLSRPAIISHHFNRQRMQGMRGASSSGPGFSASKGEFFFAVFSEKNGKKNEKKSFGFR